MLRLSTDGVATLSRLLKIIDFFCKRALEKRLYSAKDTYNSKEPTNRSHRRVAMWAGPCEKFSKKSLPTESTL